MILGILGFVGRVPYGYKDLLVISAFQIFHMEMDEIVCVLFSDDLKKTIA